LAYFPRTAFDAAWREYLPRRSEADFEEWRHDAAWHAAKYARWDRRGDGFGGPAEW
jgi:hypothetical protein